MSWKEISKAKAAYMPKLVPTFTVTIFIITLLQISIIVIYFGSAKGSIKRILVQASLPLKYPSQDWPGLKPGADLLLTWCILIFLSYLLAHLHATRFLFIRTSKFWPSLIVLNFLAGNFSFTDCS